MFPVAIFTRGSKNTISVNIIYNMVLKIHTLIYNWDMYNINRGMDKQHIVAKFKNI